MMTKKVIFICGSPRKGGNTNQLVKAAAEAAELAGVDVTVVDATELKFKVAGCTACMRCKASEEYRCVIADEVSDFVATLPEYDAIVMASPLYWWGLTAQLKIVIDRMFCLEKFDESTEKVTSSLDGKITGLLATAAGEIENNLDIIDRQWKEASAFMGMKYKSLLVPFAPMNPAEMAANTDALNRAKEFGASLAK